MLEIEISKECRTLLDKTKVAMMMRPDSVFFTTLCFSLRHVWTNQVSTAATNGRYIFWNPDFFMSLKDAEERMFLMMHETMHAAYLHVGKTRRQERDPGLWNKAGDYVINLQLVERGFKMPTGKNRGLYDAKYKDMAVEQVYTMLKADQDNGIFNTFPFMDDLLEPPDDLDPKVLEDEMKEIILRAALRSKMANEPAGTIPGEIQIFLDRLLEPKLPWHRILFRYLKAMAKNDYTWKKPNRRFFPQFRLPSMWSETLMDVTMFVDTSGSISDEDSTRFVSEISGVFKMMKPSKITLGQFDTSIKSVETVKDFKALERVKFVGRGGTDIRPVLTWLKENKQEVAMIFTDGEFPWPENAPESNIIWLIHGDKQRRFNPPFGKVIHYEV